MKKTLLPCVLAYVVQAVSAATTVDPGDEMGYFSQMVDVFVGRTLMTTENAELLVTGVIAFCIMVVIVVVVFVFAVFALKNKR
jgi:hypothetical protein